MVPDELLAAATAIADQVANHRKGRFGEHRYDVTDLGLDKGQMTERFAGYVQRYAIPTAS